MEQMFEIATRKKLRFDTTKGLLTVEDLWDLPLTASNNKACLDDVARALHYQLKDSEEVSFVKPITSDNEDIKLAFEIVKHVITVKMTEAATARDAQAAREKKQKIMAIIDQKKDQALTEMSVDELSKLIESM